MSSDDFLWPEPGRTFFEFSRTRPDAYGWMRRSMSEFAFMYRESAERLMEYACNAPGLLNVHAIPAVFLFRHYVELSIKDMLADAGALNDLPSDFPDGHRLLPLWSKLRELLVKGDVVDSPDEGVTLDVVDKMIADLDSTDPQSMSFRYPVGKESKGRPSLLNADFEYFDMRVFRDQAARLAAFIDGCGSKLSEYLDIKREMDREFASGYGDPWDFA